MFLNKKFIMKILEIENLSKSFDSKFEVVSRFINPYDSL